MLGGFVDVLAALRVGRIDQAELESVRRQALDQLDDPESTARRLPGYARNLLLGHANLSDEESRAELAAVTVADLRRVAEEVARDTLLMTPSGTRADWAGFHPAPTASVDRVAGKRWPSLVHDTYALVVAGEGVSLVGPGGQATVRYADCVAVLAHPDGGRQLTGADGMSVGIEPTLYGLPANVIARIDAELSPDAMVWMPARTPEQIPKPPARTAGNAAPAAVAKVLYGRVPNQIVHLSSPLVGLALILALGTYSAADVGRTADATFLAVLAGLPAVPVVVLRVPRRIYPQR